MTRFSTFLLAAFALLTAAGLAGCGGNAAYEIRPDPSSMGGGSAAKDSNEIVPAASGDDETATKIKELEAKIDELDQKISDSQKEPAPTTPEPRPDPNTDQGGTIDDSPPKTPDPTPPNSDSLNSSDTAAYAPIVVSPAPRDLCGNGRLDPGEECDDGNIAGWDGCTFCTADAGWECDGSQPSVCSRKEP